MMTTRIDVNKALALLKVILVAMMTSMAAFGVIVLTIGPQGPDDPRLTRNLLIALAAVGLLEVPAYLVLHNVLLGKLRRHLGGPGAADDPTAQAVPTLVTLTIAGAAMAESFGLFGLVIFLVTGAKPALAAPVIALALLVTRIPSRGKLDALASMPGHVNA